MNLTIRNLCSAPPDFVTSTEAAVRDFERLGCKRIAQACNSKREQVLEEARRTGSACGYDAATVSGQLGPPYDLCMAAHLHVDILPGFSPHCAEWAAEYCESSHTINVYYEHFMATGHGQWSKRGYLSTLAEIVWHELLHAAGDLKSLNRTDGLLRHKYCGADIIDCLVAAGAGLSRE